VCAFCSEIEGKIAGWKKGSLKFPRVWWEAENGFAMRIGLMESAGVEGGAEEL
jgi:hypothetical protein